MSRQIPNDRRLTDDERAYLLMRGEENRVTTQDSRYPEPDPDDIDLEDDGEDFQDDYDNWTVKELNAEIEKRNTEGAEISPAGTKKENLIAALREDDAAAEDDGGQ